MRKFKLWLVNILFDTNPDKYCWADCVRWAYSKTSFNPFKIKTGCKDESLTHHHKQCYCGVWQNGECKIKKEQTP